MPAEIKVVKSPSGDTASRRLPDDGQLTIGRGDLADMSIKDPYASRVHCAIEGKEGRFFLSDLGSGNGTQLNGQPLTAKAELQSGDRIVIGQTTLEFSLQTASQEEIEARRKKRPNPRRALRALHDALKAGETPRLGDYVILERIAKGGMGSVYRAIQESTQRTVALKILAPELLAQDNTVERFLREAETASQLNHRHVVAAYDYGQVDGLYFFSMEYVDGVPLSTFLHKKKRISESDAVRLALDVAAGLQHAAEKGMVHRDVKPGNLMVTRDGIVKLCDFGLAKPRQWDGPALTAPGMRVGTPTYMAPEQIKGEEVDHRTDIYSLGATLYRAVTGKKPFSRKTPFQVMTAHVHDPLPPPSKFKPDITPELEAVICKMMEKDPKDRYQTFQELRAALKHAQKCIQARKAKAAAPAEEKPAPAKPRREPAPEHVRAPREPEEAKAPPTPAQTAEAPAESPPPAEAEQAEESDFLVLDPHDATPAGDESDSDYDIVLDGPLVDEPILPPPPEPAPPPEKAPEPPPPEPPAAAPPAPEPHPIEPIPVSMPTRRRSWLVRFLRALFTPMDRLFGPRRKR